MNMSITINEERLKNTFIELVGVPCPSCDEKQEAELLVKKLQELGMEPQVDRAGEQCGGTTGNVWGFRGAHDRNACHGKRRRVVF